MCSAYWKLDLKRWAKFLMNLMFVSISNWRSKRPFAIFWINLYTYGDTPLLVLIFSVLKFSFLKGKFQKYVPWLLQISFTTFSQIDSKPNTLTSLLCLSILPLLLLLRHYMRLFLFNIIKEIYSDGFNFPYSGLSPSALTLFILKGLYLEPLGHTHPVRFVSGLQIH